MGLTTPGMGEMAKETVEFAKSYGERFPSLGDELGAQNFFVVEKNFLFQLVITS